MRGINLFFRSQNPLHTIETPKNDTEGKLILRLKRSLNDILK